MKEEKRKSPTSMPKSRRVNTPKAHRSTKANTKAEPLATAAAKSERLNVSAM
jgi:hypothetical protein